jgi:transgelin
MNKLVPGKIPKINTGNFAFKLMENINYFCSACKDYGLYDSELFQTVDLWDGENIHQVCICLQALGRKAQKNGLVGFGPKEATKNERTFTQEQINEGKKHTSLQYGTNKLANQSGQNFGNSRHI